MTHENPMYNVTQLNNNITTGKIMNQSHYTVKIIKNKHRFQLASTPVKINPWIGLSIYKQTVNPSRF